MDIITINYRGINYKSWVRNQHEPFS